MISKRTSALIGTTVLLSCPLLATRGVDAASWQLSQTSSSNGSADPAINFREGQSPSSVNDSARALMAAVAQYLDDISGSLTTTGTGSAYLVTTNQGLPNPPTDGQLLAITPNVTNGAAPITHQPVAGAGLPRDCISRPLSIA
jgi:hypothetical protein